MAVEYAIFKFGDLKVTSHDDRMTDRMTTKVHSSRRPRSSAARPKICDNCGYHKSLTSTKKCPQCASLC